MDSLFRYLQAVLSCMMATYFHIPNKVKQLFSLPSNCMLCTELICSSCFNLVCIDSPNALQSLYGCSPDHPIVTDVLILKCCTIIY